MYERLVEDWLDNASERSYQIPFCQMLVAQGHRVVHSTRHSAIELGKDIITVGPDGTPCCYQLKGNPGTRLTLAEFRQIHQQLLELINFPISDPSIRRVQHKSFLVTNGLVEEETRLAVEKLNLGFERDGFPQRRLEILQRGDLFKMAQELGHSLWPSELEEVKLLIEFFVEDGSNFLPIPKLHALLLQILKLGDDSGKTLRAADLRRRITSAAILVAVALKNSQACENHFAIISAWVIYCAYVVAVCERVGLSFEKNAAASFNLALDAIWESLTALAKETLERQVLVEGDTLVEGAVFNARYTLLLALMSVLWFWCENRGWPDAISRTRLMDFLAGGRRYVYLWGEAAIPQMLCYYWFLSETVPRSDKEFFLAEIIRRITSKPLRESSMGLASPYYDFADVARHTLSPILGKDQDPIGDEFKGLVSYYTEAVLHLLVRTGRKDTCKSLWSDITRIQFISFIPDSQWQYCLWRTDKGEYIELQPPLTKDWNELVDEARQVNCVEAPRILSENKFLFALFLILFPHRGTPSAIRSLAYQFDRTWFIAPAVGETYDNARSSGPRHRVASSAKKKRT